MFFFVRVFLQPSAHNVTLNRFSTQNIYFSFRLINCRLSQESCDFLASTLNSNSSCLRELDLSNNDNLKDSVLKQLSAFLDCQECRLQILRSVHQFFFSAEIIIVSLTGSPYQ